jgi:toxin ParE1/3/4
MRELTKSSQAERDLLSIWLQLSVHSDSAAEHAIDLIEQRCSVIQQFPYGGEPCPQFGENLRWFPAGNYVIFYRPEVDRVQVVRVLDGRRDLNRAFWET